MEKIIVTIMLTELAGSMELSPYATQNWKLPMVTSCLEEEVNSIVEKMRNACAGGIKDHLHWMPDLWFM
jgi:hypothetical protein